MKRNEKLMTITPKEAQRLLAFNNFGGQRNIRERHVVQLAEKMTDGRFHVGNVAIVQGNSETLLADGQHQLLACVQCQKPFHAVVQEYTLNGVDDDTAMARIFSQFNVDAPRTRGDIAWIFAHELGWLDWPRKLVANLTSALSALAIGGDFSQTTALSKDQSASLLSEHRKVCEWVNGMGVGATRHMLRAPVLGAMISTYRKSQKASEEFWGAVRDGDNLKKSDPRFVLREYLKEVSLQGGSKNVAGRELTNRRCMYAKCIHAWNAWREDRVTALKYHASAALPKPL